MPLLYRQIRVFHLMAENIIIMIIIIKVHKVKSLDLNRTVGVAVVTSHFTVPKGSNNHQCKEEQANERS